MTHSEFSDFYKRRGMKKPFQDLMDYIFENIKYRFPFKRDLYVKNNKVGVLFYIFGKWIWSFINTINTNYTCIFLIIKEVGVLIGKQITINDLKNNFPEYEKLIKKTLLENQDHFFGPDSEILNEIFFITQKTWNNGLSSILSQLYTLKKHYNLTYEINFDRGDKDDMTKGIDIFMNIDGVIKTCQHKKISDLFVSMDGDFFYFKNFTYSETYRKLDFISIEDNSFIYMITNSKNSELVSYDNDLLKVDKSLVKRMITEKENLTDLLIEITKVCCEKRIIFFYDRDELNENRVEESVENGKFAIRLYLNDPMDENLENFLTSLLEKLKNRVQ